MERISTGAEATVYREGMHIVKVRDPKGYRIAEIDRTVRRLRTRIEIKILKRIEELEIAPKILSDGTVSIILSENPIVRPFADYSIFMEYIPGRTLKEYIMNMSPEMRRMGIVRDAYCTIGVLHSNQIVHGDLTPNNIIIEDGKIKIIDFGLGKISSKPEDMAVDLYVFEKTIAAMISITEDAIKEIITGYLSTNTLNGKDVVSKLKEVRKRGRKRELSAVG